MAEEIKDGISEREARTAALRKSYQAAISKEAKTSKNDATDEAAPEVKAVKKETAPKAAAQKKEAAPKAEKAPVKEAPKAAAPEKETVKEAAPVKAAAPKEEKAPVKEKAVKEAPKAEVKKEAVKPAAAKPERKAGEKYIKVTLILSTAGRLKKQQRTVEALGLIKIGSSKEFIDGPAVRGMIHRVRHMVKVEEVL